MNTTLWAICFVVLLLIACMDFFVLWKERSVEWQADLWFSPFTLACQGAFSVLAAFYIAPQAFEDFSSSNAIQYAELVFLLLMVVGGWADWSRWRAGKKA